MAFDKESDLEAAILLRPLPRAESEPSTPLPPRPSAPSEPRCCAITPPDPALIRLISILIFYFAAAGLVWLVDHRYMVWFVVVCIIVIPVSLPPHITWWLSCGFVQV
jgi:hypothetical protein